MVRVITVRLWLNRLYNKTDKVIDFTCMRIGSLIAGTDFGV